MKKNSLFKFMAIIALVVLVLTYFIPSARTGEIAYLPFGDIITYFLQTSYHFFDIITFILVVGAFYGVLSKTGAYKKLLDNIVKKVKSRSKLFVILTIVLFALISSLTGITIPLFVFIPFVVSIILLLGYDKLVAISSTVVPTMLGFIGGISITLRDPNNGYGYSLTTIENLIGIDKYTNLIPQLILLVLGVTLLILFVNRYIKNVEEKKVKYDLNEDSELLIVEVKGNYKDIKTWPLIVVLSLLLVLLILGLVPWNTLFELKIFTQFHTWLTGLAIKDFPIFNSIISSTFPAFGEWTVTYGSIYVMLMTVMIMAIIVIKFIYKIKLDDLLKNSAEGAKKMLPTIGLIMFALAIFICAVNNGFIETIITKASANSDINFVIASLITMLGSILHVDLFYAAAGVFLPIIGAITDEALFDVFALMFQSLYGLISIVAPTSLILIFALSYLDIPYTTWLKYIWRFILSLFIIIFAVLLILALI